MCRLIKNNIYYDFWCNLYLKLFYVHTCKKLVLALHTPLLIGYETLYWHKKNEIKLNVNFKIAKIIVHV